MKQLIDIINEKLKISNKTDLNDLKYQYFYHEALEDGYTTKFKKTDNTIKYRIDNCKTWKSLKKYKTTPEINKGQRIYFKGENMRASGGDGIGIFKSNKKFNAGGNIMSLIYGDDFIGQTKLIIDYQFTNLFSDNNYLVSAKDLILKATELTGRCYSGMFNMCTSLIESPKLPATKLNERCYSCMFEGCTSLTKAPELPATELSDSCYALMFCNCKELIEAPKLPATKLADGCYGSMFKMCTSLEEAPELPATKLTDGCYSCMFYDCKSLLKYPELPATELAEECYYSMFAWCESLKTTPELPATKLFEDCYKYMFEGCKSLIKAPELPATELAEECYSHMFFDCESLIEAPELPATELVDGCYIWMFERCSSLNKITMLATDISSRNCLWNWVENVSKTGTFIKAKGVDIPIGNKNNYYMGIPEGWTVKEI